MDDKLLKQREQFIGKRKRTKVWKSVVSVLACIVVFCTTYALILPAITMAKDTFCGYEEHTHGSECYETQLVCELSEDAEDAEDAHVHGDECYKKEKTLGCKVEESAGHTHTDECKKVDTTLSCGKEENEEHTHTDECYTETVTYVCGQEEGAGHAHTDECYEIKKVLTCELSTEGKKHVHNENCYNKVLICEKKEHEHKKICYSDKTADLETAKDWEATLPEELTTVWADDVLAVAESQLGYTESTKNYIVAEDGETQGYTRYGEWYGDSYGHWCAMYVSFCLNYAGVDPELIPFDASCQNWIETLSKEEYQLYREAKDYEPVPGDLIFFNWDEEEDSDHVGLVVEMIEETEEHGRQVKTIEGNASNTVKYRTYDIDDESIMGYGVLPENPEEEVEEAEVEKQEETTPRIAMFANARAVELTGIWGKDLLAIAQNEMNKGTVSDYREWYNQTYGETATSESTAFVSYCIVNANIPTDYVPVEPAANPGYTNWINEFYNKGIYHARGSYVPKIGDIVFLATGWGDTNTVGIVSSVNGDGTDYNSSFFEVIRVDSGTFKTETYNFTQDNVTGFVEMPIGKLESTSEGVSAVATFALGAIPEDVSLVVELVEDTNGEWEKLLVNDLSSIDKGIMANYYMKVYFMRKGERYEPDVPVEIKVDFTEALKANIETSNESGKLTWAYRSLKDNTFSEVNVTGILISDENNNAQPQEASDLSALTFEYTSTDVIAMTALQKARISEDITFEYGKAKVTYENTVLPYGSEVVVTLSDNSDRWGDKVKSELLKEKRSIRKIYYFRIYALKNGEELPIEGPIDVSILFNPKLSANKNYDQSLAGELSWVYKSILPDESISPYEKANATVNDGYHQDMDEISFEYDGWDAFVIASLQDVKSNIVADTDIGIVKATFNAAAFDGDVKLIANLVTDEDRISGWNTLLQDKYVTNDKPGYKITDTHFLEVYFENQEGVRVEPEEGFEINISAQFSPALDSNASTYEKSEALNWYVNNISTGDDQNIVIGDLAKEKTLTVNDTDDITSFDFKYEKADVISFTAMQEAYTFIESEMTIPEGKVNVSVAGKETVLPNGTQVIVEFVEVSEDSSIVTALKKKYETERYSLSKILPFIIKFKDASGEEFVPKSNLVDINLTFDPVVSSAFADGTVTIGEWVMDYASVATEDATATITTPAETDEVKLSATENFELTEVSFMYTNQQYYVLSAKMDDPEYKKDVEVTNFEDLKKEIEQAGNEKTVITILNDFASDETITIAEDKNIVINLNGNTITASKTLFDVKGGRLTIEDSMTNAESVSEIGRVDVSADLDYGNHASTDMLGKKAIYDKESENFTYYVTDSKVVNTNTGATEETLKEHSVKLSGKISGGNNQISVINVSNGHCILNSGAIVECNTSAISQQGGTLMLNGGYICGNETSGSGAAVNVDGNGKLIVDGAVLAANQVGIDGGAIALNNAELFEMNNGVISGNVCLLAGGGSGGGIFSKGSTPVIINGGYITNNRCESTGYKTGGGAIFTTEDSTIYMNYGYITGNYVGGGGGGLRTCAKEMYMNGGLVNSNYADTAEGGGISVDQPCVAYVYGGYINNNVSNTHEHWGGGGLFCANDSTLYMRNTLVTENKAGGYGGGVAGCSTGRTFICEHNGGAIFDNTACEPGNAHLSSGTTTKFEDHEFVTEMFLKYGYKDYFSAFNSVVGGTMLGGEAANWRGSIDGVPVRATESDTLISSYLMGLTSHPTDVGKQLAYDNSRIYVNGNDSFTHGGGILCNGYMVIGDVTEVEVFSRLEVKASKALLDENNNQLALEDKQFEFELINKATGDVVATGTNDTNGNIAFDHMIPFTEEGVYVYQVYEKTDVNNEGLIMDSSVYEITVTVERRRQENLNEHIEKYRYEITWLEVERIDQNGRTTLESKDPEDKDQYPVEILLTEEPSFVNIKRDTTNISVIKKWEGVQPDEGTSISIQLMQNGKPYKDSVTLSSDNDWKWEWGKLPLKEDIDGKEVYYDYTVEEVDVPEGYKVHYDRYSINNSGQAGDENQETGDSEIVFVVTNTKVDDYGLKIKKVDSSDHNILLAGAHFELYYTDENGNIRLENGEPVAVTFTRKAAGEYEYCKAGTDEGITALVTDTITNNLGSIKLNKLPAGNYILRETIAPNGYIKVDDREITLGDNSDTEVVLLLEDEREEEDGFILPETGGPGTNVYTAGGILLLMISVLLYIKKKNQVKGGLGSTRS